MVRSSGHVQCVGQRAAEGCASCCWGVGKQGWRMDDLLSYILLGRCEVHERSSERGAGGWHRVRERLWGCGCVVRSSGRVECVGQRPAEGRAASSCCWGVGEQGWRVDDLLSYLLLGRCEVHERASERGAGGLHRVRERDCGGVGVW